MAKKITVGIIGCGVIAPDHIRAYQACDDVSVKWACDLIPERMQKRSAEFSIPSTTAKYQELLADPAVDCVSICTDHASHSALVCDALDKGKNVLCEKALSINTAGLDAMMEAHRRNPSVIFGGVFQHRFDSIFRALKKHIELGSFGTVLTASIRLACLRTDQYYASDSWRGTWAGDGGSVLINQSIHYVDALAWIMGGVSAVSGMWTNLMHKKSVEAEDTITASLRFASGALGTIEAVSSSHLDWEPLVSIRGTVGSIDILNGLPAKVAFVNKDLEKVIHDELDACVDPVAHKPGKSYYGPGHRQLIADFVNAVRAQKQPYVTGESARHAVDVVLAAYESGRTGKWVAVASRP